MLDEDPVDDPPPLLLVLPPLPSVPDEPVLPEPEEVDELEDDPASVEPELPRESVR